MRGRDLYAWVAALLLIGLGLGLVHLVIVERITGLQAAAVLAFVAILIPVSVAFVEEHGRERHSRNGS